MTGFTFFRASIKIYTVRKVLADISLYVTDEMTLSLIFLLLIVWLCDLLVKRKSLICYELGL